MLADEAIGASHLHKDEKERLLVLVRDLAAAGEQFYKTWHDLLKSLDEGSDGLQINNFARNVLKMNALRIWMEPNPVVREKIFDTLGDASVPKPKQSPSKPSSSAVATLAGKGAEKPAW